MLCLFRETGENKDHQDLLLLSMDRPALVQVTQTYECPKKLMRFDNEPAF